MKLITRDTDYAVRALAFIARQKKRVVPVSELVSELKIPRPFLRKILQQLHRVRILDSYKGQGGGFSLALPPERVLLLDLMDAFQGPRELNACVFKKRNCPARNGCPLRKKIKSIERHVFSELGSVSIGSLLKGEKR